MKIEHVAMYVSDLERAKDFFRTYFGAVSNGGYFNARTGFCSYFLFTYNQQMYLQDILICKHNLN